MIVKSIATHAFLQPDGMHIPASDVYAGLGSSSMAFKHNSQAACWSFAFLDLSVICFSTESKSKKKREQIKSFVLDQKKKQLPYAAELHE